MDVLWQDTNIFYNILCFLITENEKLFDRSDARLYWKTVLHIFSLFHHAFVGLFATSLDIVDHPIMEVRCLYTYRYGYLTAWNFTFQTVFLCLALTHDMLEWLDKHESKYGIKIRYWRDLVFSAFVVPLTMFVTGMFWSVYWIDRELVFPNIYDNIVPWWFNNCVHTNTAVMVLIETLLQARRYPVDDKLELRLNTFVSVLYAVVYYGIYFFASRWLYRVHGVMTWWQVCLYQLFNWIVTFCFYKIQYPINRLIHGSEENQIEFEFKKNEAETQKTETAKTINSDVLISSFSTKSWILKYRSVSEQCANSRL